MIDLMLRVVDVIGIGLMGLGTVVAFSMIFLGTLYILFLTGVALCLVWEAIRG